MLSETEPQPKKPLVYRYSVVGDMNDLTTQKLMDGINWAANNNYDEVNMTLSSYGGFLDYARAAYDHIRRSALPVDIIVEGMCSSAAICVLQAARTRSVTEHSYFMTHMVKSSIPLSEEEETEIRRRFNKKSERQFLEMIIARSNIPTVEDFKKAIQPVVFFTPKQMKKFGLVDNVIEFPSLKPSLNIVPISA